MKLDELRQRHRIYMETNKHPRLGCEESGKWEKWQCCDFHRKTQAEYEALIEAATILTKTLFPDAILDEKLLQIGDNYMWLLFDKRWWKFVDSKIRADVHHAPLQENDDPIVAVCPDCGNLNHDLESEAICDCGYEWADETHDYLRL